MTSAGAAPWVVCQIGARENYSVARALHRNGRLAALITDAWMPPLPGARLFSRRLANRYHPDLEKASVLAPTVAALAREGVSRAVGRGPVEQVLRRNAWFQRRAVEYLSREPALAARGDVTVFAYSYAALGIFEFAKAQGWRTVLGQIDPGVAEEKLVAEVMRRHGEVLTTAKPASYWETWRKELALADVVMANSEWSRAGIASESSHANVAIIPVAFDSDPSPAAVHDDGVISERRPLRALFLGQVIARKGVFPLLDAIRQLRADPIEFDFVGPCEPRLAMELSRAGRVRWHGAVPRDEVGAHYGRADVFLFPTLSDGFGLTQVEALSRGVPVIASTHCARVVSHEGNGLVLPEVTAETIAAALRRIVTDPPLLASLRGGARGWRPFGIDDLYLRLASLG